uniref:Predicted protein n=1 Tax=Hordeum vulgare subsp. vulgare TaxID=112509 RepID=F2ELI3_HORVV|nr:predicted protein [Hordeum vulgare subsp. vulgare]
MGGPKGDGDAAEEAGDGKKSGTPGAQEGGASASDATVFAAGSARTTATGDERAPWAKPKAVYHDPSIPRPQDVYLIRVNNCNSPFDHVWLERSDDGTRPIHPLEKLPVEQFIDRNVPESEPVRPADVDDTPFTLVEDLKGLTELVNKLKDVNEFAVSTCN